ncbi:hypothetical protein MVLG_02364 [Microbotryum lychnidis-dioicae p1A1 Lamole]|uniref:Alpha/beta hydrolase fold-3 domain-containing protein n=1 Tax=Microbotryum lychnidis-dioicae (strain p1A1 Lamole / MvSl-1064) TaxID=683840 RepID=U5H4Y2_USTV1|nr:hypothetical protein MVLG_02364 [Microbotryum lychnidis-dioicae p1A1 Lamole]|eukprot:KDE07320.1 hypothetical protein MVLG_02364 [Microbotryum lychnidis-dioicae p1A1 Lamole]
MTMRPAPLAIAPAPFSRQPLKAIYLTYVLISILIRQPYWILRYYLRLRVPYPRSWSLIEALGAQSMRQMPRLLTQCDLRFNVSSRIELPAKPFRRCRALWVPPASDAWMKKGSIVDDEIVKVRRCPAYVYGKDHRGLGRMQVKKGEHVLLYFHGGANLIGNASELDGTAQAVLQLLSRCSKTLQHALSVDYTKAGDLPFPAHLQDAISAYAYLVSDLGIPPSSILVGGDSAGGGVAMCLLRYLRDVMKFDEMPRATLLLSPACDLSGDLERLPEIEQSEVVKLRASQDMMNRVVYKTYMVKRLLRHHPPSLLRSPYLSPASPHFKPTPSLFKGFPRVFITCGGIETFRHSIEELASRFRLGGVETTFHLEPDAVHDYVVIPFWNKASKAKTFDLIASWVNDQIFPAATKHVAAHM